MARSPWLIGSSARPHWSERVAQSALAAYPRKHDQGKNVSTLHRVRVVGQRRIQKVHEIFCSQPPSYFVGGVGEQSLPFANVYSCGTDETLSASISRLNALGT
jgi:hypothetical protein